MVFHSQGEFKLGALERTSKGETRPVGSGQEQRDLQGCR